MLQIINITAARNGFAKLVEKVKATKEPIIVVQDSIPSVVIYPYDEVAKKEEEKEQLFKLRFQKIFNEGEKTFSDYLKSNKLPFPSTEEEAYKIIKNA